MPNLANLTVVSTRFLVGLCLLTVVAWSGWLFRRRLALSRWKRWSLVGLASLLTIAAVADGFNSYYSYLPNVSDVADAIVQSPPPRLTPAIAQAAPSAPVATSTPAASAHLAAHRRSPKPSPTNGRLMTLAIPAGHGIGRTLAWVWLPPQYFQPARPRLPVLYLFHGSPGLPADWFHGGRAATVGRELAQQNRPVIEVAPQLSRNWLDDPECVDGRHEQVESHLLDQVIPTVDATLRTIATRTGRIFAGMSAGGFCALNLGLRHRNLVATILDLSGYTRPTHSGGMTALFGSAARTAAVANSPDRYAARLNASPPTRVWLDAGSADKEVVREMAAIAPTLRAAGLDVVVHVRPGGHTYSVWRPALHQSAEWAMNRPA